MTLTLRAHHLRALRDPRLWFGAAILVAVVAMGANLWVARILRAAPLFRPGDTFALPVGRTVDGAHVDASAHGAHACSVVRYASERCPFCQADAPVFAALEDALGRFDCVTWLLAPAPELFPQPARAGRVNLAFLDVASARGLHLAETPTTIVVDRTGVIRWSKIGALEPPDVDAAVAAVPHP